MQKITFHRFVETDFSEVKKIFFKTFNKKISKKFYKWRYFKKNRFNSFIAKIDKEIVGHVGFVEYNINSTIKNLKGKIYSRHTSMVLSEYRKNNIYLSLLKWSINKLEPNLGIITWPNKLNILASKKIIQEFKFKYLLFYKRIENKKKDFEINFKLRKLNKYKFKLLTDNKQKLTNKFNIINKNSKYFYWRYFDYNQHSYFYFQKEINDINNIFIIGKLLNKKKYYLSILDYIGSEDYYFQILEELINNLQYSNYCNKNYFIQIWSDEKNLRKVKLLKKYKFKIFKNIFNINLINTKSKIKNNFSKINFEMGDTDVFINIDKNN